MGRAYSFKAVVVREGGEGGGGTLVVVMVERGAEKMVRGVLTLSGLSHLDSLYGPHQPLNRRVQCGGVVSECS